MQIVSKGETLAPVPLEQFGKKFFMDWALTLFEGGQFPFIVVHQNYVMTQLGKTRTRHQAHIT